ncbi:trypsin-like serine protease [Saccharopolyspora sp. K220]|uniref:trypsin-like serine protease n=1 Tax=Saccharopolyspora soli TaxID=2926618 RepID=UPI001F58CC9B|nr:trypsin-like serine protease [Saccharopolyspora soli]MCI2418695.1 trypsin-like serine protease [Saccharopolyspora soli]
MRIRFPFLVAALALAATAVSVTPALAIKGGTESPEPYSFMGSLQRPDDAGVSPKEGHACGVMVLAPQWVLTSSHCARNPNLAKVGTPRNWRVRIGSLNLASGGEVAEVDKFYRLANEPEGYFGKDVALLHLRTPVRAEPVRIATGTPAENTPARFLGWGMTCDDRNNPECFPERLREADTVVQPPAACPEAVLGAELCIGPRDGSIGATNMDSGGPALVRDGDRWAVAGTVTGPSTGGPTLFTDVTKHTDWINGMVTGTSVPPEVPIPSLEGRVDLVTCVGSVVRTATSQPEDPALLLTNGHCVEGQRPAPGSALVDQPADRAVEVGDREGYPQATARANRLVYATMTGTDIALYRLDKSYGQLAAEGAKVFQLATTPTVAGEQVDAITGARRYSCNVEAVVPHLREDGYQMDNSLRYTANDDCGLTFGTSGSPLVTSDGNTVVGVHNTHNQDGEQCTANNPCEVAEDGTVTAERGRSYGQRVDMITACLTTGSALDLSRPECTLTRPA